MSGRKALLHFGGFFLLSLIAIGALRSGQIPAAQMWLWGVLCVQLAWGCRVLPISKAGLGNIKLALGVLVVVQVLQYALNVHSLAAGSFSVLDLVRYFVFIALVEEIWFRGVLQDNAGKNKVIVIVVGSVIFGVYHLHSGLLTVLTTGAVGLLYSAARAYGAGILSLALVHGAMNWMNNSYYPPVGLRVEPSVFYSVFPIACCLVVLVFMFVMSRLRLGQ